MFNRLSSISPVGNTGLKGVFLNGEIRYYDISRLFDEIPIFRSLLDKRLFESVKVDNGGFGISWNDDIDLSSDEIYENGTEEPR